MTKKSVILALLLLALAGVLRIPGLSRRPMHGDEAVQAYKLGQLLEENFYRYDPYEYHGPTLNYFTLIPAYLTGKTTYASLTEFTVRIVPVCFGIALVLLPLLLTGAVSRSAAFVAAALAVVSPAFVFYSRYYIHEILLVFFTFAFIVCAYRYAKSRKLPWLLAAGLAAGLAHATKETCLIAFAAVLLALILNAALYPSRRSTAPRAPIKTSHCLAALVVALGISALLNSSFLSNPPGVLDSFRTYGLYLSRASDTHIHHHPWDYYLRLLFHSKSLTGPPWTEALILILALVAIVLVFTKKLVSDAHLPFLRFLAFFTVIITAAYSLIPYKTPWCLLTFHYAMILLAGFAAAALIKLAAKPFAVFLVSLFLALAAFDLALQAFLGSYVFYADHINPYVYAHPTTDVFTITDRIEDISAAHPLRRRIPIEVVCTDGDYWPLPWYLRSFGNVGWRNSVDEMTRTAPVVIANGDLEQLVISRLFGLVPPGHKNLYMPLFDQYIELRPTIELRGYITKDLLDHYHSTLAPRDLALEDSQTPDPNSNSN